MTTCVVVAGLEEISAEEVEEGATVVADVDPDEGPLLAG